MDTYSLDVDRTVREQLTTAAAPIVAIVAVAGLLIVHVLPLVAAWQTQLTLILGQ